MKQILLTLAMSIAICFSINAQTITWDGGAGTTNWSDAMNWNTNALPAAADDVDLDGSTVVLDVDATVQRVYAGGSSNFTVNSNITLTVTGFTGGDDGLEVQGSATLVNNGTINISAISGSAADGLYCKGTCTNSSTGIINIDGTGEYGIYVQGGLFTNDGMISATNFGQANSDRDGICLDDNGGAAAAMTNNGTITITMTGGDDGIYVNDNVSTFNNNSMITIGGATGDNGIRIDDTAVFNNNSGASLTINSTPDDQLFLDNTGVFNNAGTVNLNNGSDVGLYVTDDGKFFNMSNGNVNVTGASNFSVQIDPNGNTAEIINDGTLTTTGGKDGVRLQEGGTITNNASGTLDINTPVEDGINVQSSGGTITNNGTIDINGATKEGVDMSAGTFNNNMNALFMAYDNNEDNLEINGSSVVNNDGAIRTARTGADASGRDDIEINSGASLINTANATFAPGTSPGELEVRNNINFGPSTITFEIDGTSHTADYDRVEQVEAGATVDVTGATAELVWGYTPTDGDCYDIVIGTNSTTPGTVLGPFASVTDSGLDMSIYTYDVFYTDPTKITVCVAAVVVPVELVSFTAQHTADGSLLDWQTANEINNEGFQIERSLDGRAWEMIDFVEGQGNSDQFESYEYLDTDAQAGVNYYRLKQMDFDGQYEYSEVVLVESEGSQESRFSLYPNPVENELFLELDTEIQNLNIRLVDTNGRLVWSHQGWIQSIPFSDIESGLYILSIEGTNFQETRKITRK